VLFTNSILAVDVDTGEYRWHYQTVPEDAWDYDSVMPFILRDMKYAGKQRRVIMQAPKNGFFYVLDARTGELLAADPIVDITWATHVDLETGRPVEIASARYYNGENPEQGIRVLPFLWGAHNWQPMSYSPKTRLVYIPAMEMPANYAEGGAFGASTEFLGYGPDEEMPDDVGQLIAWDPVARGPRWTVPYSLPFNGGVLSTAGNLVFQGTATGEFIAYTADTGKRLWSAQTTSATQATPVSYELDGEQYVLLPSGCCGGTGLLAMSRAASEDARGPSRVLAFKLGGTAKLPEPTPRVPVPKPPARTASADEVARGSNLWADMSCELCHGPHVLGIGARRLDGAVPDLRYAPASVHTEWTGIVLGGNRRMKGMPSFGDQMSAEDAEALRAYVIEQAWKAYEKQAKASP